MGTRVPGAFLSRYSDFRPGRIVSLLGLLAPPPYYRGNKKRRARSPVLDSFSNYDQHAMIAAVRCRTLARGWLRTVRQQLRRHLGCCIRDKNSLGDSPLLSVGKKRQGQSIPFGQRHCGVRYGSNIPQGTIEIVHALISPLSQFV